MNWQLQWLTVKYRLKGLILPQLALLTIGYFVTSVSWLSQNELRGLKLSGLSGQGRLARYKFYPKIGGAMTVVHQPHTFIFQWSKGHCKYIQRINVISLMWGTWKTCNPGLQFFHVSHIRTAAAPPQAAAQPPQAVSAPPRVAVAPPRARAAKTRVATRRRRLTARKRVPPQSLKIKSLAFERRIGGTLTK